MAVWGYSIIAVVIISLVGLLGVAVIPIMQKVFYNHLLQFLVALAVGALAGDALLHLFPHVSIQQQCHVYVQITIHLNLKASRCVLDFYQNYTPLMHYTVVQFTSLKLCVLIVPINMQEIDFIWSEEIPLKVNALGGKG